MFNKLKNGSISDVDDTNFDLLHKKGFVIDKKFDETAAYLYYYNRTRFCDSVRNLNLVIVPTYNCNLACSYCLQGNIKKKDTINLEDATRIICFTRKYIENSLNRVPIQKLNITFHGGEPLLAFDICNIIAEQTTSIAQQYSIAVNYTMSSNLTLLNTSVIDFIKKYDIYIQASIDGNELQHDSRRMYRNKKGTYGIILHNLENLANNELKKNVIIRINLDNETIGSAESIINNVRKFSDDIYFAFLRNFKGKNDNYAGLCIADSECASNFDITLSNIYKKYDLSVPATFGKKGPCSLNCENKYYIDCYLDVYKCELLLNQPEYRIGFLGENDEIVYLPEYYRQMSWTPEKFNKCMDCVTLPCCGGGCPAAKKEEYSGDIMNVDCQSPLEVMTQYLKNYVSERVNG